MMDVRRPTNAESSRSESLDSLLDAITASATTAEQAAKVFDRVLREIVQRHHQTVFWGDRMLTLDKSAEFREDPVFRAALAQAGSSTGENQYESPDGIAWRYNVLIWAARTCLALPGDFVECGVYRGDMTWMVTQNVDIRNSGKIFYLYDTFSGFAPQYSSEADFPDAPHLYQFIDNVYRASDIEDQVRRRFRGLHYVVVTKGIVPDVLTEGVPARIAFLHLDMNSPRAEVGALEALYDRLSTGGIVVFDDYGWKTFRMQKAAADEFMASRGQIILELPTGQGLMIKRDVV
jgi:O-methyltransferase